MIRSAFSFLIQNISEDSHKFTSQDFVYPWKVLPALGIICVMWTKMSILPLSHPRKKLEPIIWWKALEHLTLLFLPRFFFEKSERLLYFFYERHKLRKSKNTMQCALCFLVGADFQWYNTTFFKLLLIFVTFMMIC